MNKYKCKDHILDLACLGCVRAWIARHDRMLKFINQIIDDWECDPNDALRLLEEIGKE